MKRTVVAGIITGLALALCIVVPAHGQNRVDRPEKNSPRSSHGSIHSPAPRREFAPRIIGRAHSFIVSGRLVALRGQRFSLETARGARLDFQIDEQTMLLESSELVSIATLDDITLRPSDLRLGDEVEVVAERAGSRALARIVTRTAAGQPVARR